MPNFPDDNSSEFDDSDRDVTFNPASEDSSSDTSYTEETEEVLNDTYHQNQQLSLGRTRLEKQQRPRHNLPSYVPPNTSIDDSFDINVMRNIRMKHMYRPADDDTTANSSNLNNDLTDALIDDITNCTDDSPHVGIHSNLNETCLPDQRPIIETETPQNTLLSDSVATSSPPMLDVASYVIIGVNSNILADDSYNSIIENSDYSNVLEQSQYQMHIPPSESDESDLTKNHTITSQSLSHVLEQSQNQMQLPSETNESDITKNHTITSQSLSHVLEQSQNQMQLPSETNESDITKNHTITSQSLSQDHTTSPLMQDTVPTTSSHMPNFPDDNSSEFDDSDRDVTFNPASEDSSSDTSYTEETEEVLNDTYHQNQQLSLGRTRLEKQQDLTSRNSKDIYTNNTTNDQGRQLKESEPGIIVFFC
ncbi:anaphase-promoting complex subunit cdh1-like [Maniola hyperantus]|uniref:anaphase-promoting complex subunit cdh1-like n=1 Tax=Aphantopus hyperantus TaxID=2795564 RepID=UPI00374A3B3A